MNRIEQCFVIERLAEVRGRASGQAPGSGLRLVVSGDNHDRQPKTAAGKLFLDIHTAHAGHVEIQHDTIRKLRRKRVEEIPPRREGRRIQVRCAKEPLQGLSHGLVIIDNGDVEP